MSAGVHNEMRICRRDADLISLLFVSFKPRNFNSADSERSFVERYLSAAPRDVRRVCRRRTAARGAGTRLD